jgi:hypothetical protein
MQTVKYNGVNMIVDDAADSASYQMPVFTEQKASPTYNLEHQIFLLRSVNTTYKDRINKLSAENLSLQARVSILCSMLCDAGIPLPPDLD